MEDNKTREESVRAQADEETQDDAVDHEQLARLIAARHDPIAPPQASLASPSVVAPASMHAPQSRPKSKAPVLLIAFGIILAALPLILWFGPKRSVEPSPLPPKGESSPPGNLGPQQSGTGIKAQMIAIPSGTFQMGRTGSPVQEAPPHSVAVHAFLMDNTEVTNAEYAEFVREMKYAPPSHWGGNKPLPGQEQWPVTNVSVGDANAFAAWRSKRDGVTYRLPTEEEWEYAARNGEQDNLYPWGNSYISGRAATRDAGLEILKPVGSYPDGKNRWGVMDLIGNVWEWTSSKAYYYPGSDQRIRPAQQNWVIIRGGSLASDPLSSDKPITAAFRDWIDPMTKNDLLGFRLVREGS